ncbi:MAG: hypothetical protein M3539_06700 [Acidobacteriota bacterium]|nr:hypothetical protein [Acidobacteriota bacterium]
MRFNFHKLLASVPLALMFVVIGAAQTLPTEPAAKLLVDRLGELKAATSATSLKPESLPGFGNDYRVNSAAQRSYVAKDGQRFGVTIITTDSDAGAYALLTNVRRASQTTESSADGQVGTASFVLPNKLVFVQGRTFVVLDREDGKTAEPRPLTEIAKVFAERIDRGEGEIPVLVKHLPDWERAQQSLLYAVTQNGLKNAFSNQPVFDAVSFEGGAEAVIADYQGPRLVIVEFNTPQLATDNNQRITARIQELRNQGQPTPTAYRRVGNYSVFVLDAANEESANQLADQVKYQQVVQWLGRNPNLYDKAANEFTRTTLGVFIAVVKASGLAIIGSLALGGLLGALLFSRRRKQQRIVAYSDAGGMLRLNLDDMTAQRDPARLLGPGIR